MVRAKFECTHNNIVSHLEAPEELYVVVFAPVTHGSEENDEFYRSTPYGDLTFGNVSKEVSEQFSLGQEYYIDVIDAIIPKESRESKKAALLFQLRRPVEADRPSSFTITIVNQNMHHPERISWQGMDNLYKADFIDENYNQNLVNNNAPFIQIVGWDNY